MQYLNYCDPFYYNGPFPHSSHVVHVTCEELDWIFITVSPRRPIFLFFVSFTANYFHKISLPRPLCRCSIKVTRPETSLALLANRRKKHLLLVRFIGSNVIVSNRKQLTSKVRFDHLSTTFRINWKPEIYSIFLNLLSTAI